MLILWALELVLASAIIAGFVTQLLIPLWRDTPTFPLLRSKRSAAERLELAKRHVHELEIEAQVEVERRKAHRLHDKFVEDVLADDPLESHTHNSDAAPCAHRQENDHV